MDHYKVLGVHKSSTKEEIKHAFRKLAMEFHPDKHSQSSNQLKDSATLKFKQISEAYETLIDDRKRTEYNLKRNAYGYGNHYRHQQGSGYGGGGGYNYGNSYGSGYYGYSGSTRRSGGDGIFTRFEIGLRFLTTKSFLLNATFACVLLGAMVVVDASGQALWKMQNHGKSFQEALDSLDKSKPGKDGP